MRFLIDAQLPLVLADSFRQQGHEANHVMELGLLTASDAAIWNAALSHSAVLVTKDRDFSLRRAAAKAGPAILWTRIGNTDNRTLIARITQALPSIVAAFARDSVVEFTGR